MCRLAKKGKNLSMGSGRFWISCIIIVSSFALIAYMLGIQHATITTNTNEQNPEVIKEIHLSNQTVFNILLPVFGAWVGAVVAFYFGAENLQKAHDTLEKALSGKEKLATKTVSDMLNELPETKNLETVTLDMTVSQVNEKMKKYHNVLVVDSGNKPLGVLYEWDFLDKEKASPTLIEGITDGAQLKDVIGKIKEPIREQPWDVVKGVQNFAAVYRDDTLLEVKGKLESLSKEETTAVRGIIVEDKEGTVIGTVNFLMLSYYLK
jgi:CBS domain-containing protein